MTTIGKSFPNKSLLLSFKKYLHTPSVFYFHPLNRGNTTKISIILHISIACFESAEHFKFSNMISVIHKAHHRLDLDSDIYKMRLRAKSMGLG